MKRSLRVASLFLSLTMLCSLVACKKNESESSSTTEQTTTTEVTSSESTTAPTATSTSTPTETPTPTDTPTPTETPVPTDTPTPAPTATPTSTPTPKPTKKDPTPTPEPPPTATPTDPPPPTSTPTPEPTDPPPPPPSADLKGAAEAYLANIRSVANSYGWTVSTEVVRDTSTEYGIYVFLEISSGNDGEYHSTAIMIKSVLSNGSPSTAWYQRTWGSPAGSHSYDDFGEKGSGSYPAVIETYGVQ